MEELGGASPLACNVLRDGVGASQLRPAIATWDNFPATAPLAEPVTGLTVWRNQPVYISGRQFFVVQAPGLVTALSDSTDEATMLNGTKRPSIYTTRTRLVAAAGGEIQQWQGTGLTERLNVASPAGYEPPRARVVTGIENFLIAARDDASGIFQWSAGIAGTGVDDEWDPLDYYEAQNRPDEISTMSATLGELYVFGSETLQVYDPDPTAYFVLSRVMPLGILAPASLVPVDNNFIFLDRRRRFILTDGRTYKDLSSDPLLSFLQSMKKVDDCWGFRMVLGSWDAVVWIFPTEGKGLIWDKSVEKWSEWREWNGSTWCSPSIVSAYHWTERGVFLVGLKDGTVAQLDPVGVADLGQPIHAECISGFVDRQTKNKKNCVSVALTVRRDKAVESRLRLWNRDATGAWKHVRDVDLGPSEGLEPTVVLRSLGTYRQRQWRYQCSGAARLSLVSCMENYDILEV